MMLLQERTPLYAPKLHMFEDDGLTYALDDGAPNWIVVEPPGRRLLEKILDSRTEIRFGELVAWYAAQTGQPALSPASQGRNRGSSSTPSPSAIRFTNA